MAGIERGAAGNHDDPVNLGKVRTRIGKEQRAVPDVVLGRIRQHARLLGNFLGHEVLIAVLLDLALIDPNRVDLTICASSLRVAKFRAGTRENCAIAFLKVADLVSQRAERDGIRTEVHFAVAEAERERRSLARRDNQIVLAVEKKCQREGAFKTCNRLRGRIGRSATLIKMKLRHERHGFCVGLGLGGIAVGGEFLAQFPEILDDPVMDDRNAPRPVGVGVCHRGRAMRRPAGVPDAGLSWQGVVDQHVRKIDELANRTAAVQRALVHGCNSGAVVSPVFKTLERLDQGWRRLVVAQDAYNAAHCLNPTCPRP